MIKTSRKNKVKLQRFNKHVDRNVKLKTIDIKIEMLDKAKSIAMPDDCPVSMALVCGTRVYTSA